MKKSNDMPVSPVGGSSLLIVLCVVCLVVFALGYLSPGWKNQQQSENAQQSVTALNEADLAAEKIYARLRSGEEVPGVTRKGDVYSYACAISSRQYLAVEVTCRDGSWEILRWEAVDLEAAPKETAPQ